MNGLPYYKAYPNDFIEGTIGMPFELKGAYRLLLDLIYMQAGRLVDDPKYIAAHLGCSVRAWNKCRSELIAMGKISVNDQFISNFRATLEVDKLKIIQDKQRENASKPSKNNDLPKVMAQPNLANQNQNQNQIRRSLLFIAREKRICRNRKPTGNRSSMRSGWTGFQV